MSRKRRAGRPRKAQKDRAKQLSITLRRQVYEWAKERQQFLGYSDNFSAYLSDLIRKDKLETDNQKLRLILGEAEQHKTTPSVDGAQAARTEQTTVVQQRKRELADFLKTFLESVEDPALK